MNWQTNPYALALIISALVSIAIAIYAWRRRPAAAAATVGLFLLAAAEWSLAYALELGAVRLETKIFWAKAQYLGIVATAPLVLVIAVKYLGHDRWLTRRNLALLASVPIAILALLLTNDLHGLIWEDTRLAASGPYQMLAIDHGSFFWVLVLYSYACLGLAALLLARNYVHATKLYRAQTGVILAGTLMPWLANAFYLFNSTLFPYLDLTPLAFTLTGLLAAWGLFRYRLLEVGPIYNSAGQMTHFGTVQEAITIQKQTEEALTRLLELSRVLATSRDMDVALVKAVNSAVEIVTAAGRSTLQWLESDGETLRTVATSGTGIHRDLPPFQPGVGIAGYALLNKEIINVPDVLADERFVPGKPPLAFRSLLVAPLIVRDQALGTISLSSEQTHAFSPTDETLVGLMADQIAAALDNARAFTARRHAEEALHRHSERLQILHEIDQSILAARLPETIAVAAIGRIRKLIPCHRALVMTARDDRTIELLAAESSADLGTETDPNVYHELLGEQTLQSGWVHGVADLEALARRSALQQALYAAGIRSYVVAPLYIQGELVGMLNLESRSARAFTADHITIATEVAALLAVAIRQARLFEQAQQEIAERMQAEKALRQYTIDLEAQNAELSAFAHTVAHDLKNPLSTLVGYAQMLEHDLSNLSAQTRQEALRAIVQNGLKMGTIIDELLLLASVRARDDVETHPLEMRRIVTEARGRLLHLIEETQGNIIVPDTWPVALGHGPWVEAVWANYISNALKYGGRPPLVELGANEQEDGWVRFWVRDNGPGLTPEQQAHLFTPFERLHQVRVQGHGLGLTIVQRIVNRLGGQVGVESNGSSGHGCTFFFTLPGLDARRN